MRDREVDRIIGVADRMKLLVAVFDAHDDLDRIIFVRRRNLDRLETTLERAVFLDRLAVFRRRGCAYALNLSTRKSRFQNVGRVQRTLGGTGTHQSMKLVDEDDGVLILHQLFHDGLEPLFELATVLGPGDDEREIERQYTLVSEETGHFAVRDALREPFDNGRLSYSRLADQNRIVLGAAAQDLHHPLEFLITADQRVKLVVHRGLGQVAGELNQQAGFTIALRRRGLLLGRPRQLLTNGKQTQSALVQYLRCEALLFTQQSQQEMFRTDMLVREPLCFLRRVGQHPLAFIR